jgi:predicted membrane chloride channel (bestrophin family)
MKITLLRVMSVIVLAIVMAFVIMGVLMPKIEPRLFAAAALMLGVATLASWRADRIERSPRRTSA